MAEVAGLTIYPVKSMAGVAVESLDLLPRGPRGDRRYMVVDKAGQFVTARAVPRLLAVQPRVEGTTLVLSAPGYEDVRVAVPQALPDKPVRVWRDNVKAAPCEGPVNDWLSAYLGQAVSLVYMADQSNRPIDPDFAHAGEEVSFADGFPLLVISQASLDDLNQRAGQAFDMRRFRPNIVLSGTAAGAEDTWARAETDAVCLEFRKACARCIMTTFDPDTQAKHPRGEPLRTLGTYRRVKGAGVMFGHNAVATRFGRLSLGDRLIAV